MTFAIIKVLIGLFVWMVLPRLIYNKRKYKKNTPQFFANIACKIIGIAMIVFAVIDFVQILLSWGTE
jgi:C4-dicarboxylate transporter